MPSSRSISWFSWPKPLTTRTPVTAPSTTPATSPAFCWASQLAGNSRRRDATDSTSRAGPTASEISASSGDRKNMTPMDSTNSSALPISIGIMRQQALDHVQVGDGPADDLAGVELVLPSAVQPGQRAEQLGAQVVLHIQGELAAAVAAQVDGAEADHRRDDQQRRARPDRLRVREIALSMMSRWISGMAVVTSVASQRGAERDEGQALVPPAVARSAGAASPRRTPSRASRPAEAWSSAVAAGRWPVVAGAGGCCWRCAGCPLAAVRGRALGLQRSAGQPGAAALGHGFVEQRADRPGSRPGGRCDPAASRTTPRRPRRPAGRRPSGRA